MVKVIAKCIAKTDSIDSFKDTAYKLIEETRKETGCIKYELYNDTEKSNIYCFVEDWKDEASLKSHQESAHYKEYGPRLEDSLEKEVEVTFLKLDK